MSQLVGAAQEFDLVNEVWKSEAATRRRERWLWFGGSAFLLLIGLGLLIVAIRDFHTSPSNSAALLLSSIAVTWFFLVCLFQGVFGSGSPPTRLRIDDDGVSLSYLPGGKVRFRAQWSSPHFQLIFRDFRPFPVVVGSPNPLANDLVLDTGDHAFVGNFVPVTAPPSAFLTEEAFQAVLAAARSRNMDIRTTRDEGRQASPGWFYPDVTTRVTRPVGRSRVSRNT